MKELLFNRTENFNNIEVPVKAEFMTFNSTDAQYVVVTFSDAYHTNFKMYYNPLVEIKDLHIVYKFRHDTRLIIGANTCLKGFTINEAIELANMIVEELHKLLTLEK